MSDTELDIIEDLERGEAGVDASSDGSFAEEPDARAKAQRSTSSLATAVRVGEKLAKYLPSPGFIGNDKDYKRSEQTMAVMKDAIHQYSQDKYFESGEVTATVKLEEDEDEDEAIIISLYNVHKTYLLGVEGVPALRGVTMQVRRGEFLVIYGTSGGGKTSLLNIMGTIDKPTKGNLKICGTRISKSTSDAELSEIRRNKLGFVFQTFNLLSALTAEENVEMPMILAGDLGRMQRVKRARQLLARVGMGKRLDHLPSQLSGGEQQRVTIARAISNEPDVLLLDEPTGDLDSVNTMIVMKLLMDLNKKEGITLIMVTHDVALKGYADRVVWMRDGKIQRVELVPEHVKATNYEQLSEDFEQLNATGKFDDSIGHADPIHTRLVRKVPFIGGKIANKLTTDTREEEEELYRGGPGSDEEMEIETREIAFEHTEVRQPSDYKTHSSKVRADEGTSGTITSRSSPLELSSSEQGEQSEIEKQRQKKGKMAEESTEGIIL